MKRIIAASLMTLAAALTTVVMAEPAHALTICNSSTSKQTQYYDPAGGFNLYATVPSYGTSVECYMNYGATGTPVRVLQTALNFCYSAGLTVDGILGTNTTNALKSVQSANGLNPDGGYGPDTRRAMKWKAGKDAHGYYHCGKLS